MATNKKAAAPAQKRRALEVPKAPAPASSVPAVGVDPRDGAAPDEVRAAPPTPTRETAATANDEPGAGGDVAVAHAPRRKLAEEATGPTKVVNVAKPFTLTDASGLEHRYPAGEVKMPADHAEHWYTKAHLKK